MENFKANLRNFDNRLDLHWVSFVTTVFRRVFRSIRVGFLPLEKSPGGFCFQMTFRVRFPKPPWNLFYIQILPGIASLWLTDLQTDDDLQRIPFWVQIRGIPLRFLTQRRITFIGERLGHFVETYFGGDGAVLVDYVRIKLLWNMDTPLRFQRLFQFGDEYCVLKFRYEKLCNFCTTCGLLSHEASECLSVENPMPDEPGDDDDDDADHPDMPQDDPQPEFQGPTATTSPNGNIVEIGIIIDPIVTLLSTWRLVIRRFAMFGIFPCGFQTYRNRRRWDLLMVRKLLRNLRERFICGDQYHNLGFNTLEVWLHNGHMRFLAQWLDIYEYKEIKETMVANEQRCIRKFVVMLERITKAQYFQATLVRKCWCHYVSTPELALDTSALMLRFVKRSHSQRLLSTIRNKEKSNMKLDNNRFFDRLASKATLRKASSNSLLLYFLFVYGLYICVCNNCVSLVLYVFVITLID